MENPSLGRKNYDISLLYISLIIKRIQGMEYRQAIMGLDKKGNRQGYKDYTNTLSTIILNNPQHHKQNFWEGRRYIQLSCKRFCTKE